MTRRELQFRAASFFGAEALAAIGASMRYEISGKERVEAFHQVGRPVIYAHWHTWILPLTILHRREGIVVLVSEHGDGEYIARVIHRMGFATSRGSSTRGGVAGVRGLVRALKDGKDAGITPDGPKGPAGVFKPGGLVVAQLSGAPIIPIHVSLDRAWRLDSWDRFAIPKPFARVRIRYGQPQVVPRDASEPDLAAQARAIEVFLNGGVE
ncbi:MAG: lysophospholipid acyltransferase family protein [Gemmatimonadota bacterium]